jgi:ribosomal protein L13
MKDYRLLLAIMASVAILAAGTAHATGKRKCAEDYRRFCSQWGLETRGLENCMRRHGDQLSHRCIKGLIQAGAVSQAEVNRRRAALGR